MRQPLTARYCERLTGVLSCYDRPSTRATRPRTSGSLPATLRAPSGRSAIVRPACISDTRAPIWPHEPTRREAVVKISFAPGLPVAPGVERRPQPTANAFAERAEARDSADSGELVRLVTSISTNIVNEQTINFPNFLKMTHE